MNFEVLRPLYYVRKAELFDKTVFNCEQVDDPKGVLEKYRTVNETASDKDFIDYEPAEQLIQNSGVEFRHGGDRAFYRPSEDFIQLPFKQSFEAENEYYAAAFHELVHSTEKSHRCNWSGSYAEGELRAEIGSAFLLNELGVPQSNDIQNTCSYLESWLSALRNDNKFIFRASTAASKACDFLLGKICQESENVNEETLAAC